MKRQWCSAINCDITLIKDHDKVCSKHFEDDDLERKPDSQGRMPKKAKPTSTAIPSKFLNIKVNNF